MSSYAIKAATHDMKTAHTAFTDTVNEIDKAQHDVLLNEKLNRIDTEINQVKSRLDQFSRAAQRPALSNTALSNTALSKATSVEDDPALKAAFNSYLRRGNETAMQALQTKALDISVPTEGGYTVTPQIDANIELRLRAVSPLRAVAQNVQVGTSGYSKLVASSGLTSGWAAEQDARPSTAATTFTQIIPPAGDLYANPSATQFMLDDAFFNVEQWLTEEIARDFAQKEGSAFINGNGTAKPKGFLTYPIAATTDAVRAFGTLQYNATGVAGGFSATAPAEQLIDLLHSLRATYRQGAVWVMNSKTVSIIRKFKDATGHFIWQPSFAEGRSPTLLGYDVVEAEDMPDVGTGSLSIAFGNFYHGYIIADRIGTRILRDPFTNKPYVQFYATKRVGGAVLNSEAIKLMKFDVS